MKVFIFIFLFIFQYTYAGILGDTKITARVLKYDKHTVTLALYGNQKFKVPISSIQNSIKNRKLKTGIFVTAVFSAEETLKRIQK